MNKSATLLRGLEHEALKKVNFYGRVLDLGGSKKSDYYKIIYSKTQDITVVNIDEGVDPDIIADVEKTLPIKDNEYDFVVAMNLLEHVFDYNALCLEINRVLKAGGNFVALVPFLLYVHSSPADYFRFTSQALSKIMRQAGFKEIVVEPLGFGIKTARQQIGQTMAPAFLLVFSKKIAIVEDIIIGKIAKLFGRNYNSDNFALGYFISAKK